MIQRIIVSLVILFGILMLLLPKTDDESVAMLASGAMLKCSMDYRHLVAQQVIAHEPVSVQFNNTCPDIIAAVDVKTSGEMVITGSKHSLVLTLVPIVEHQKVLWSCKGKPAAVVTQMCKPLPIKAATEPAIENTSALPVVHTAPEEPVSPIEADEPAILEEKPLYEDTLVAPKQEKE